MRLRIRSLTDQAAGIGGVEARCHQTNIRRRYQAFIVAAVVLLTMSFLVYYVPRSKRDTEYPPATTRQMSQKNSNTNEQVGLNNAVPQYRKDLVARKFLTPPGYPWHTWNKSRIDAQPLIEELHILGSDKHFRPSYYRNLIPYVIRYGEAFFPKAKKRMLKLRRWRSFEGMLDEALNLARRGQHLDPRLKALVSGEFPLILSHGDHTQCNDHKGKLVPVFGWYGYTNPKTCAYSWPVLSYNLWSSKKMKSEDWDDQFKLWDEDYSWSSKITKAVWRGSMTGPVVNNWSELPRVKLVQHSIDRPDIIDAGFSGKRRKGVTEEDLSQKSRSVPEMLERDYMRYKAIVDIDGNTWSARFGLLLCYNSVIIKVNSPFRAYFESELKPWEHFIPVNADLSDLESAVSFAIADENEVKVQSIISNAQSWCRSKLVQDHLTEDFMWTLASYVELLNKDEGWEVNWKMDTNAYNLPEMEMEKLIIQKRMRRKRGVKKKNGLNKVAW